MSGEEQEARIMLVFDEERKVVQITFSQDTKISSEDLLNALDHFMSEVMEQGDGIFDGGQAGDGQLYS